MKTSLLALPFLLAVGLIAYVHGSLGEITLWNALPVAVGFGVLVIGLRRRRSTAVAAITFSVVAAGLPTLFHLAWLFDWDGTATGSGLCVLAYFVLPIGVFLWATGAAAIAWFIARCISPPVRSGTE